ncbi:MAG TPA: hypothetical protein VFI06_18095, partial [Chitinophagaceae bacterium]|nr:hypothetical protein [Chitinophagaceae bacterium]
HAVIITHVDLAKDRIKFANSWSKKWGDKGFGYFSKQSFWPYVFDRSLWAIEMVYERNTSSDTDR